MNMFAFEEAVLRDSIMRIKTGKILDNSNAHQMIERLQSACAENYRYVVLNMQDLEFLSSAGVGAILSSVDMFRQKGGDIILCCVSATMLHIFKVLDVADYLVIAVNEKTAIATCEHE